MKANERHGTVGALALTVGGIVFGVAIALQEVGSDPAAAMRIVSYLALGLIAVGIGGLLSMMYEEYSEEEITA